MQTPQNVLLREQRNEITAHLIYKKLAASVKDAENSRILRQISDDEMVHYHILRSRTQADVPPDRFRIFFFYWISRILGLTFGVKLLERGEDQGQKAYVRLAESPDNAQFRQMLADEERHEDDLIGMINEERLNYMGSVVLGLNDALVELTGALAGYTFAFQNPRLIALTGLITGISATFSMSASEYMSTSQDEGENAGKSALYTGIAYIFTVIALILPYLLLDNPFVSLAVTLAVAVIIILLFNYYISVARATPFRKRFLTMTGISLGVAALSFGIGVLVKQVFGIDV